MLPETVKACRAELDMTQDQMCAALDVSRRALQGYEQGGDAPRTVLLAAQHLCLLARLRKASAAMADCMTFLQSC